MLIPIADITINGYICWGEFDYLVPIANIHVAVNNYTCFLVRLQHGVLYVSSKFIWTMFQFYLRLMLGCYL